MSDLWRETARRLRQAEEREDALETIEWTGPVRGCRVYRNANQSIPNAAWTDITFTTEIFDLGGCWDAGQPTRLVAPRNGYYLAEANINFNNAADTDGYRGLAIVSSGGNYLGMATRQGAGAGEPLMLIQATSGLIYLAAGDYVTVRAWQDSGAAMNVLAATVAYQMNCRATLLRVH